MTTHEHLLFKTNWIDLRNECSLIGVSSCKIENANSLFAGKKLSLVERLLNFKFNGYASATQVVFN